MLISAFFRKIVAGVQSTGIFNLFSYPAGNGNGNAELSQALPPTGVAIEEDYTNALMTEDGQLLTDEYGRVFIRDV